MRISHLRAIFLTFTAFSLLQCSTAQEAEEKELKPTEKARLLVRIANTAIVENDPTSALINLKEAEMLDPKLAELHHSKAVAYYARKDLQAAIRSAERAVQLRPKFASANNTLGKLLVDSGRFNEAVEPLTLAAVDDTYRGAYKARTYLGILYYKQRQFSRAGHHFKVATRSEPKRACVAHFFRGKLAKRKKNYRSAAKSFELATNSFCSHYPEARYELGLAYTKLGKFDLARKTFLNIQDLHPDSRYSEKSVERLRNLP